MKENKIAFWNRVKALLREKNMTQKELAKKAMLSYHLIAGQIRRDIYPLVSDAVKVAAALDTSVEFLTTGKIDQPNNQSNEEVAILKDKINQAIKILEK